MVAIFKKLIVRWYYRGQRITAAEAKRLKRAGKYVVRRREHTRRWYYRLSVAGQRIERPGFTDRSATLAAALKEQKRLERLAAGLTTEVELEAVRPLAEHLLAYRADLLRRGNTEKHVALTLQRIVRLTTIMQASKLTHITPDRVTAAILTLRQQGLSVGSTNHYLTAIKMLTRWAWRRGKLASDPLAGLSRSNAEAAPAYRRITLEPQQLARLIEATQCSRRVFRGLDGQSRAVLYLVAATTGLRAHELATLTEEHVSLDPQQSVIVVEAGYSKRRRTDVVPLPEATAERLRQYLSARKATGRLWPGSWYQKAARMLLLDLEEAGIEYDRGAGKLDFHSLRSFYATLLARQGVNLQTAQALLRHSDPKLTASIYTKLGITDLGAAVRNLRVVEPTEQKRKAQIR